MLKNLLGVIALTAGFGALAQELPNPTLECSKELAFEPRLESIADKVALIPGADVTPAISTLDRVATADERPGLELWAYFRKQCFDYGAFHREAASPDQAALAARTFGAEQRLLSDLRQGRSTYAEFNRRSAQLQEAARLLSQSSL